MKRIPSGFDLGPHKIKVEIVSEEGMREACRVSSTPLGANEEPPYGLCNYRTFTIYVQKVRGKKIPKALQMHAFWHEYFHMLLYVAGRERLSRDEVLVDNCGGLQLQAFNTAEF